MGFGNSQWIKILSPKKVENPKNWENSQHLRTLFQDQKWFVYLLLKRETENDSCRVSNLGENAKTHFFHATIHNVSVVYFGKWEGEIA